MDNRIAVVVGSGSTTSEQRDRSNTTLWYLHTIFHVTDHARAVLFYVQRTAIDV